jgi:hypothetical protein
MLCVPHLLQKNWGGYNTHVLMCKSKVTALLLGKSYIVDTFVALEATWLMRNMPLGKHIFLAVM